MPPLDLADIQFSKAGSFLKINNRSGAQSGRLMIATSQSLTGTWGVTGEWPQDFYEIALFCGSKEIPYSFNATPWRVDLTAGNGRAGFAFLDDETFVFSATGVTVKLLPCHSVGVISRRSSGYWFISDSRGSCCHHVRAGKGATLTIEPSVTVKGGKGVFKDAPYALVFSGKNVLGAIRFSKYDTLWQGPVPDFKTVATQRKKEWEQWLAKMPVCPEKYRETAHGAWYILWSSIVEPAGMMTRRSMLMSKHWMNKVWSWDNCFNALSVARAEPELAFDQLRIMFDQQSPTGAFPDSVDNLAVNYNYVKPPVYGWTMTRLIERLGRKTMLPFVREAYGPVCRQTRWWYEYRDSNRDGLAQYFHGNDSGWDNATAFDQGYPAEGADLAAHLVMQMEGLALMADMLGKKKDAAAWRRRAREQLATLLEKCVRHDRFCTLTKGTMPQKDPASLLNYMPVLLGRRLPRNILLALVKDLSEEGRFLTRFGLATQAVNSKAYSSNGYWRGPIWAPSTYLIFDGLVDAGEVGFAAVIARRFCDLCMAQPAMWENFDAVTGKGLCCPAYTWTAAVFLLLTQWLAKNDK